ncbi:MFS transporter [Gordonia desulfuricans]|uniref:MFS transporter n=1 Tax=Gordonia desulfuricans TaxID=89051 RepID=A0A7K3LVS8_9ACTN|nr:MFS transporter [Gordonia desulfuricans]NDK92390.1 MFS transporter [Gordonia desulfuricans]
MTSPRPQGTLRRTTLARYGLGSLGTGGFATLPGLVLVYYLTDTLGVAAVAAGAIVAIAKIWDVLIDPAIGALSDHDAAQRGSRRRFMTIGALALPVFFALTFAVPTGLAGGPAAVWVTIAFLLAATTFSLFQVPYIALPAELTDRYDERTRLLTVRVAVLTVGILAFGAGGPALRELGGSPAVGYLIMAVVSGVVIGAAMLVASRTADDARPPETTTHPQAAGTAVVGEGYRTGLAVLRRSAPLRTLLGAFVLQGLATGLMLAGAQYIATWVLDSEAAISGLFAALIAPALICAPLWGMLSRRIGKEAGFAAASVLFAVATLCLIGLWWSPGGWVYLPIGVAGAAYAGMQSLPMAMLPDVITHDERRHGQSTAGVIGGVWTAGETSGMALGAVVFTVLLALGDYISSDADSAVHQPRSAIVAMVGGFSVVPAALTLVSLLLIARYPLRRSDIDATPSAEKETL